MEQRYVTNEFKNYWDLEAKYKLWLNVEYSIYKTQLSLGTFPDTHSKYLSENIKRIYNEIDVDTIQNIEKKTRHDVVAFLEWLESISDGNTKYFHYGMTSSDLVDTALSLQISDALHKILNNSRYLEESLEKQAQASGNIINIGRTHGMYAQRNVLSNFFAGHLSEIFRARDSITSAINIIGFGKLSGPVGAYANISMEAERLALRQIGLSPEPASTQIIPRDRHLDVIYSIAKYATAIERFATNIRHLHRSEISEIHESFSSEQKGSSSMPHKRNPAACEQLCGLSRYIRGLVIPAFENVTLWHERDISHSSVERMIIPEAITYLSYMIQSMTEIVNNLNINVFKIEERVKNNPQIISESLMNLLINKGKTRSEAHKTVQDWVESDDPLTYLSKIITAQEYNSLFDDSKLQNNAKLILQRVLREM